MKVSLDGLSVFVGTGGVPWLADQQTLFFQHGAGMDRTVWVLLARYFARHGYNVVTADLPGHGASDGQAPESIEDQAAYIWTLIDCLQAEHGLPAGPVVLAGHSMGALTVAEAAGMRPQAVEHLLLFGSGYPMPVGQILLDAARNNEQSAVDMIAIFGHSYASQLGHNPVAGINVQQSAMALLERAAPGVLHTDLSACNNYQGLEQACANYGPGKTTLIVGDSDQMTAMKMSQNFAKQSGAKLVVLRNCGHMVMSEQPEQTLQAAREVLLQ